MPGGQLKALQVRHQETPSQLLIHSVDIYWVAIGGKQITQQGPCLPEPSGPKLGLRKRQASPTTGSTVEVPWSVPTLPHRVLTEGSGRQRAIHMDCAVRVWLSWTLTPTTSVAWGLAAFLAASWPVGRPKTATSVRLWEEGWAGQPLVASESGCLFMPI